jgi:hypothetical protein
MPISVGIAARSTSSCSSQSDVKPSLSVSLLALAAALVSPRAWGQTQASEPSQAGAVADAVELKNGAYLRGLILEVDPTSHLTLKLPSGETRKIPIAEIASAERSGKPLKLGAAAEPAVRPVVAPSPPSSTAPAATESAPPATPAPAPPPPTREIDRLLAAIPGPRVKLSFTSNEGAFLEREIGQSSSTLVGYHVVCQVPCKLELPALDPIRYRIDGNRTEATEWFKLPQRDARLHAELASDTWGLWPPGLLVAGTVLALVGGGMIAGYAVADGSEGVRNVGIGLAAGGGVLLTTSGVLYLVRPTSTLSIEPEK